MTNPVFAHFVPVLALLVIFLFAAPLSADAAIMLDGGWGELFAAKHPPDARKLPLSVAQTARINHHSMYTNLWNNEITKEQLLTMSEKCPKKKFVFLPKPNTSIVQSVAKGGAGVPLQEIADRAWTVPPPDVLKAEEYKLERVIHTTCPLRKLVDAQKKNEYSVPITVDHNAMPNPALDLRSALQAYPGGCAVACAARCQVGRQGMGHEYLYVIEAMVAAEWLGCRYVGSNVCSAGAGARVTNAVGAGFFPTNRRTDRLVPYYCHEVENNYLSKRTSVDRNTSRGAWGGGMPCYETSWPLWLNSAGAYPHMLDAFEYVDQVRYTF